MRSISRRGGCLAGAVPLILALGIAQAAAQEPSLVKTFEKWSVYTVQGSGGKTCFMASDPSNQDGNFKTRDAPSLMVARLPGRPPAEQVSMQPGYTFQAGSKVNARIDGRPFQMFTQGGHAWAQTAGDDRAMIDAMRRGSRISLRGTSTRGTYSEDTYSLAGFTAAFEAMRNACGG